MQSISETTLHKSYDAVIAGARCAGAATGMLLARRGLRVLLADRGVYGADTISTHALMRGAVMQLARWGVLDAVKAAGTAPVTKATFHYGDEAVAVPIRPGDGADALYAPKRTVLDRILVDAAREAGAEVRFGCSLTDVTRAPDGRVTGAVLRDRSGTETRVDAGIVIGADGIRSTVAGLVGAEAHVEGRAATAVLFGYFRGLPNEGYHWHYWPGRTAGAIPTSDGDTCIFLSVPPGELRASGQRPEEHFRAGLAGIAPRLAEAVAAAEPAGRLRFFGGVPGYLRRAAGPGWALVGDAGYFKDPVTAHGITDAFRDAELLARAVAAGTDHALADYQFLRDALSLPLFRVTEAVASFDWTLDGLKPRLEALNAAMQTELRVLRTITAGGAHDPARVTPPRSPELAVAS